MKIALDQCDFGFFTLSNICDERRRPEGRPAAALITVLMNPVICPAVPRRGPEAGSTRVCNFHRSGVNLQSSCPFLQSRKNNRTCSCRISFLKRHLLLERTGRKQIYILPGCDIRCRGSYHENYRCI